MVKISNRLTTASALVTQGYTLADVGTDHGYIPIYLLQQEKIPSAIAMDINEGPLERAKEHIALYGLQAYIQTRLSDGVAALKPGEVEAVLIAGMGGGLVMHILQDGEQVCRTAKELILQPQSEIERVREFLREEGYTILAEDMVYEDGKFYPMMKVQYQGENENAQKASEVLKLSDLYGGLLLQNRHPVLKTFLEKEKLIYTGIKENLAKQPVSEKIRMRLAEVEDILHYNELALQFYQ
ncbi:tRNA (adenine(22)-N(1))-methyltransferase [Roseburia inulinivorans]|jgi:tRNA (adenine22-N1)-methyltransferase